MKNKIKIAIMMIGITLILSGCGNSGKSSSSVKSDNAQSKMPNIISYGANYDDVGTSERYAYLVDRNTGVVYLAYDAYRRHAITVMFNADGTPVTASQIGLEY